MVGKGRIEHLGLILEAEAEKGVGILGLWVNWTPYRHQPVLFSEDLRILHAHAGRDEVASEMNGLWGKHGVAAIVHRRRDMPQHLAGDPSAWLENELRTRNERGELADFTATVVSSGSRRCFAVLVLADEPFPYDGKSKSEWQCGGQSLPIVVHDAEHALPSGLGPLKHFDDLFQTQVGLLQYYLCQRWREKLALDEQSAREVASQAANEFIGRNGPKRAREFASLNNDSKALTSDEERLVRERLWLDLAATEEPNAKIRLSSRNTGLLSWFMPVRGESAEAPAKIFSRCFGPPRHTIHIEDSLASALINNLDPAERRRVSADPSVATAVHTLVTSVSAMRLSNVFAHDDEYKLRLPTFILDAICRSELRNLERINDAWRH